MPDSKIVILTPSRRPGGAEKSASRLAKALGAEEVFISDFEMSRSLVLRAASRPLTKYRLSKKLAQMSPDLVISFQDSANALNLEIGDWKKIVTFRSYFPLKYLRKNWIKRLNFRKYFKNLDKADAVVANSRACADLLPQAKLIYNGIDLEEVSRLGEEPAPAYDVLAAGRNEASKSFETVEKACEGFSTAILSEFPSPLSVGWQDNPYKFYSKAKIYVSASEFEGCSNALLEAMWLGCVPVALDAPGVTEIVSLIDTTNLISERASGPYGLKKRIQKLLENESLLRNLKEKAKRVVKARFSSEREAEEWKALTKEVLEEKNEH